LPLSLWICAAALAAAKRGEPCWPDFRGPGGDGHAGAAEVPVEFADAALVRWKTGIHGVGWSSPVAAEGVIWLTTATADGRRLSVLAVDAADGAVLHDIGLFEVAEPGEIHPLNSYASPSPVVDGERAYVHFGTYGTACIDADRGEVLWQRRDLNCEHIVGPGSSPVLSGDHLVFSMDGGDRQFVVALDRRTGATVWQKERPFDYSAQVPDLRKAFSTPLGFEHAGEPLLFSSGARGAVAYDPETGAERWRVAFDGYSVASRPVHGDGRVYFSTGFNRPQLYAVRLGGAGDVNHGQHKHKAKRDAGKTRDSVHRGLT